MSTRPTTLATLAVCGAFTLATIGGADHIPGHENGDPIFPMPIPGQDTFTGGIIFVTLIGPDAGETVYGTTFDITYVSDGATPASDLHMTAGAVRDGVYQEVVVNGSDLGFGDGPGTFSGTISTDGLNGVTSGGFFRFSVVDLSIGSIKGGIDGTGYFVNSFILFDMVGEGGCVADTDGNGQVDVADLVTVVLNWGCAGACTGDVNADGRVDVLDMIAVITGWGACP